VQVSAVELTSRQVAKLSGSESSSARSPVVVRWEASVERRFFARREGRLAVEVLLAQEAEIVLASLEEGEARLRA